MSETPAGSENLASSNAAKENLHSRRKVLNERLLKWSKWFIGGTAVGVAGVLAWPAAPVIGIPLAVGGSVAETVGTIGILGNVLKRIKKSNRE